MSSNVAILDGAEIKHIELSLAPSPSILTQLLFQLAQQVSPALSGQTGKGGPELLRAEQNNHLALQQLYQQLQQIYPSAGLPYWRVRGWGVLSWQPIYLSFLSVYGLQAVPSSLGQIAQQYDQGMVSGFFLPESDWLTGSRETLILEACRQLKPLFQQLQQQFVLVSGIKPGLCRLSLADRLLLTLARLSAMAPSLAKLYDGEGQKGESKQSLPDKAELVQDAWLWLKGLGLPEEHQQHLLLRPMVDENEAELYMKRRTCCMHYRREDGSLCENCPRDKKNKRIAVSCLDD